ncbi:MAG TPA: hypothetical protein VG796_08050 [Verrucomicrobiales bacterium]|nr:hypothetical protein [Verrucomicrobiales bacterium]
MPGVLGYGWHEGNRGEYLAQYFLTALGVSAPVIRQEDIGVDFFCSLAKEENKKLTFHSPFIVQQGAVDSKEFVYGGLQKPRAKKDGEKEIDEEKEVEGEKKKAGKWMSEGIDWLFSQKLPLFVCTTDREKARFRLYSTSPMWLVHYHFPKKFLVELCPDKCHDPIRDSQGAKAEHHEGYEYHIPLREPIVDLDVFQLDKPTRTKAIEALEIAIRVEQENLAWRDLGIHAASWFTDIKPNEPDSLKTLGGSVFWTDGQGPHVPRQIESLKLMAINLALNLHAQKDEERLKYLAPIFAFYAKGEISPWIIEKMPDVVLQYLK